MFLLLISLFYRYTRMWYASNATLPNLEYPNNILVEFMQFNRHVIRPFLDLTSQISLREDRCLPQIGLLARRRF